MPDKHRMDYAFPSDVTRTVVLGSLSDGWRSARCNSSKLICASGWREL